MDSTEQTTQLSSASPAAGPQLPYRPGSRFHIQRPLALVIAGIALFLVGVIVGVGGIAGYFLLFVSNGQVVQPPPPRGGTITVQADKSYVTHLVEKNVSASGMPGNVKNIRVNLVHNGPITVTGDDEIGVLGLIVTKHFVIDLQPVIRSCQLQIRVVRADLDGVPVTNFTTSLEERVNRELELKTTTLPRGFTYCMTGVRTEPTAVFLTYSAVPI